MRTGLPLRLIVIVLRSFLSPFFLYLADSDWGPLAIGTVVHALGYSPGPDICMYRSANLDIFRVSYFAIAMAARHRTCMTADRGNEIVLVERSKRKDALLAVLDLH